MHNKYTCTCTCTWYLGCAVLLCLVVCLTLLASFFLPSHLSLKHVHVHNMHTRYMYMYKNTNWKDRIASVPQSRFKTHMCNSPKRGSNTYFMPNFFFASSGFI